MPLEPGQLVKIAEKALGDTGTRAYAIRLVAYSRDSSSRKWRITVSYNKVGEFSATFAAMIVDDDTGQVTSFWEGRAWK